MAFVNLLKLQNYSDKASWAIWNEDYIPAEEVARSHLLTNCTWRLEDAKPRIIKYLKSLRTDVVILGINASTQCQEWSNYHYGGKSPDKNLMFAFDKSAYRGCYMTDFSHYINNKAKVVYQQLLSNKNKLKAAIALLIKELNDVGVPKNALFLLLGRDATELFKITLLSKYHNYISLRHCSMHGITAHDWVKETWCNILIAKAKKKLPPFKITKKMQVILAAL